jgi:transposase-like protein
MVDLSNPIFHDAEKARRYLETERWPDGPVCPHCGSREQGTKLKGKSTRPGVYKCKACEKPYTVTVGTVFERSHVPLNKWLLVTFLMTSAKKSLSAHQVHRTLGVSYKTAWFMCHRVREAMKGTTPNRSRPIGGENKVIESDETYVGGKAKNAHKSKPIPKKRAVLTLVEREGEVRSRHIPEVTAKNVREHLVTQASRKSYLMTDDAPVSHSVGKEFAGHGSVNHSADEYVRLGGFIHVNTAESYHSLIKRALMGAFHAVSEQHLPRYLDEFAFRWNHRIKMGFNDTARANAALKGIEGKQLTYRRPDQA